MRTFRCTMGNMSIQYLVSIPTVFLLIFFLIIHILTKAPDTTIGQVERTLRLRKQYLSEEEFENSERTRGYKIVNGSEIVFDFNDGVKPKIVILTLVRSRDHIKRYDLAISTVSCYAKIHGYHYIVAVESDFDCHQVDEFFPRHCIAAKIARHFKALLFLDADMGVVDPSRKIEEFLFDGFDITFYDRFFNWEIVSGSYLIKNTPYAINFLEEFSEYGSTLPNSFHGSDNGALHFFMAERMFPEDFHAIEACRIVYNYSRSFIDVFTYEACLRSIFGSRTDFGRIKVLRKGTGWARDSWLTNSVWNKYAGDFMIHGMKNYHVQEIPEWKNTKVDIRKVSMAEWFYPLAGKIDQSKCHKHNMTWNYDYRLIGDSFEIEEHLDNLKHEVVREQMISLARITKFI